MTTITAVGVHDVRFPTSLSADGSDAMNKDGDYSAAYVVLETDDPGLAGYGFTFTIGRGNDLCVEAARQRAQPLVGRDVDDVVGDLGGIYRELASDSQLRWLGPEKGVVHLAMAAVMNAVWDLAARRAGKPLWRLLADMTPEQLVDAADLRYLSDVLTRDEAIAMLAELEPTRAERIADLEARGGYPCYTTSAGWLGYCDEKLRRLLQEAVDEGYRHVKLKVGANLDDDIRRLGIAREVIGRDADLMIDANQVWDVPEAIEWVQRARGVRAAVDRGADEPRRRARPRRDPQGRRTDRCRHRRARHEPRAVQADVPGRGHRLLPARLGPPGERQRDRRRST